MVVRLERIDFQAHRLPLCEPFKTAFGLIRDRTCAIVRVIDTEGRVAFGEASPLDGFGMEPLATTEVLLKTLQVKLVGVEFDCLAGISELLTGYGYAPAAKHGMELALCNLLANTQSKSLCQLLSPHCRDTVTVNALIGGVSPVIAAAQARSLANQGYTCIKVKVGTDRPDLDWQRVAAVRGAIASDVKIRLDANQAWSVEEAIFNIRRFEPLGIEYVEQPVAKDDLVGMAKVRQAVDTAIAADEAITSIDDLHQVIAHQAADIAILKPMAMGGILTARQAAAIALEAGLDVVITTTIDGAIARLGALHLAASIPQLTRACGLATGELLETDLLPAFPVPDRGAISIPQ